MKPDIVPEWNDALGIRKNKLRGVKKMITTVTIRHNNTNYIYVRIFE